jgi:hypothetical protein
MRTISIKHLLFGALCIGTISLSACKKYLEVDPQGQLTEVNYFETSNDAVLGTNAVYNVLRNAFFNEGLYPILDIMSDDTRKGSNASMLTTQALMVDAKLFPKNGPSGTYSQL